MLAFTIRGPAGPRGHSSTWTPPNNSPHLAPISSVAIKATGPDNAQTQESPPGRAPSVEDPTGSQTVRGPSKDHPHPLLSQPKPPTQISSALPLKTDGALEQTPPTTTISSFKPKVTRMVASRPVYIYFLINTRTTYAALPNFSGPTQSSQVSVVGIDGQVSKPRATPPLFCSLHSFSFTHSSLVLPSCPTLLLGRDILFKLPLLSTSMVTYLEIQLSPGARATTPARAALINNLSPPSSKREIHSFLGLAGFFRIWIPNFTLLAHPLYKVAKGPLNEPLNSSHNILPSFCKLQTALVTVSTPSLPNISQPFTLYCQKPSNNPRCLRTTGKNSSFFCPCNLTL
uniref:Peptidase A2 domain-containing protein n=1 Tax=Macaca fascicularis TaxID=9541 RepID=A0A7N9C6Z4_MACFA